MFESESELVTQLGMAMFSVGKVGAVTADFTIWHLAVPPNSTSGANTRTAGCSGIHVLIALQSILALFCMVHGIETTVTAAMDQKRAPCGISTADGTAPRTGSGKMPVSLHKFLHTKSMGGALRPRWWTGIGRRT